MLPQFTQISVGCNLIHWASHMDVRVSYFMQKRWIFSICSYYITRENIVLIIKNNAAIQQLGPGNCWMTLFVVLQEMCGNSSLTAAKLSAVVVPDTERTCLSSSERNCSKPPHLMARHLLHGIVTGVPVRHLVAGLITAPVGRLTLDRHCRGERAIRGRKTATILMMMKTVPQYTPI